MGILQGSVICPGLVAKEAGAYTVPVHRLVMKSRHLTSALWGFKGVSGGGGRRLKVGRQHQQKLHLAKFKTPRCSYSSSEDDNGSTAEDFNENDGDYVNSSVVEAVEVKSGVDGFMVKMRDGRYIRCVHSNPQAGHLPDYAPHPAIVLKMEDVETQSVLLMAAVRNVQIARPTMYQVIMKMIDQMGYAVKLVRVTKRVHEAYFAQLYLTKVGEAQCLGFDLRPSDAINIAVRCKVPIQVNRYLAYNDGMRVIETAKLTMQATASDGLLFTELDRPSGQPCVETTEFNLLRSMLVAAVEERYQDAAQYRDKLTQLRSKRNWT